MDKQFTVKQMSFAELEDYLNDMYEEGYSLLHIFSDSEPGNMVVIHELGIEIMPQITESKIEYVGPSTSKTR